MNRHLTHRLPGSASAQPIRRSGTPTVALVAFAAACVLAACGSDETIAAVAQVPAANVQPAVQPAIQPAPVTRERAIAATVAPSYMVQVADRTPAQPRAVYGQISAIEPIKQAPKTSGAGAVVGGVLGAVVGNQIGSGNGRAAATVLGGVGGAVVGNKVEKHRSETVTGYRVHVRLDQGGSRSFDRTSLNGMDVGDRVRVDGGRLREV